MIKFTLLDSRMTQDHLGLLPLFFSEEDPRPAKDQLNEAYAHGGGFSPFGEGEWNLDASQVLHFPGDPPMKPLARATLHEETLIFYRNALLAIVQPDGTFKVTRVD